MPDPVDLDRLEALHNQAPATPWAPCGESWIEECIVELHNAFPAMAAELRALRERAAATDTGIRGVLEICKFSKRLNPDGVGGIFEALMEMHGLTSMEAPDA